MHLKSQHVTVSNIPNGSLMISRCRRIFTELTPSSIKSYETTRDGRWMAVNFFRKIETFNCVDFLAYFLRSSFFVFVNLNFLFPILQYIAIKVQNIVYGLSNSVLHNESCE